MPKTVKELRGELGFIFDDAEPPDFTGETIYFVRFGKTIRDGGWINVHWAPYDEIAQEDRLALLMRKIGQLQESFLAGKTPDTRLDNKVADVFLQDLMEVGLLSFSRVGEYRPSGCQQIYMGLARD